MQKSKPLAQAWEAHASPPREIWNAATQGQFMTQISTCKKTDIELSCRGSSGRAEAGPERGMWPLAHNFPEGWGPRVSAWLDPFVSQPWESIKVFFPPPRGNPLQDTCYLGLHAKAAGMGGGGNTV